MRRQIVSTKYNNGHYHSMQFFLFIGRQPTTWTSNNCLQIMSCSCAMLSNCVWLQIIFCSCVNDTPLFSFLWSLLRKKWQSLRFPKIFIKKQTWRSNDKTVIGPIIAKYRDLSVSRKSIWLRQIIDLLATDKSRYFAQPRPIIVNYSPYFYSLGAIFVGDWPNEWSGAKQGTERELVRWLLLLRLYAFW